mgnify:CR=1 FL=1
MKRVRIPPGGFHRIAVLRLSSLGDVILTLPVTHELARAFPDARLEFWTREEYAEVVRFDPAIAHVRSLERDALSNVAPLDKGSIARPSGCHEPVNCPPALSA